MIFACKRNRMLREDKLLTILYQRSHRRSLLPDIIRISIKYQLVEWWVQPHGDTHRFTGNGEVHGYHIVCYSLDNAEDLLGTIQGSGPSASVNTSPDRESSQALYVFCSPQSFTVCPSHTTQVAMQWNAVTRIIIFNGARCIHRRHPTK